MSNHVENLNNDSQNTVNQADTINQNIISQFFNSEQKTKHNEDFRTGHIAIVGRPNVGKSTLMNHILGQKLSITSRKPQTTRHRIMGIYTDDDMQAIFVDTPGIHAKEVRMINERMNQTATSALADVDVVLFVVDGLKWVGDDELVFSKLQNLNLPIIAVINKSDTIKHKGDLLALLEKLHNTGIFSDVIPISALRGHNLDTLLSVIHKHLPICEPIYNAEQMTDRSERFLASEIIREKVMRTCGDEIPYDLTVQIDTFKDEAAHQDPTTGKWRKAITFIDATIFVERKGQKTIIIGEGGEKIKQIGMDARLDMEKMFEKKIMLTLWVKVKKGWSDDERALTSLGY
ncbi:GTPase Era [Moraxella macacae 0408225]|uniref:GTPase Era n=1 Tax=Moraxella macacae 0408225 TaxID=1230338 RepID=L2F8J2_9GAMM|nr:GTPase Era [Moraxella macacae]ELA09367.1 GTPase Era [Moraxella macacae 0408225]